MSAYMVRYKNEANEWTTYHTSKGRDAEAHASARKAAREAVISGRAERASLYKLLTIFNVGKRVVEEVEYDE